MDSLGGFRSWPINILHSCTIFISFRSLCQLIRFHAGHAENALHTLLSVEDIATFASYTNTSDVPVEAIFNVKDFRAMLSLCEALHCNLKLYFQGQGHPLLVEASMAAAFGQVSVAACRIITWPP
jgi:hypothetical protein